MCDTKDIDYDFSSKKQEVKKLENELGINLRESDLPWNQPIDKIWLCVRLIGDHTKLADDLLKSVRSLTELKKQADKAGDVDFVECLDILIDHDKKLRVLEQSVIDTLRNFYEKEKKVNV